MDVIPGYVHPIIIQKDVFAGTAQHIRRTKDSCTVQRVPVMQQDVKMAACVRNVLYTISLN